MRELILNKLNFSFYRLCWRHHVTVHWKTNKQIHQRKISGGLRGFKGQRSPGDMACGCHGDRLIITIWSEIWGSEFVSPTISSASRLTSGGVATLRVRNQIREPRVKGSLHSKHPPVSCHLMSSVSGQIHEQLPSVCHWKSSIHIVFDFWFSGNFSAQRVCVWYWRTVVHELHVVLHVVLHVLHVVLHVVLHDVVVLLWEDPELQMIQIRTFSVWVGNDAYRWNSGQKSLCFLIINHSQKSRLSIGCDWFKCIKEKRKD